MAPLPEHRSPRDVRLEEPNSTTQVRGSVRDPQMDVQSKPTHEVTMIGAYPTEVIAHTGSNRDREKLAYADSDKTNPTKPEPERVTVVKNYSRKAIKVDLVILSAGSSASCSNCQLEEPADAVKGVDSVVSNSSDLYRILDTVTLRKHPKNRRTERHTKDEQTTTPVDSPPPSVIHWDIHSVLWPNKNAQQRKEPTVRFSSSSDTRQSSNHGGKIHPSDPALPPSPPQSAAATPIPLENLTHAAGSRRETRKKDEDGKVWLRFQEDVTEPDSDTPETTGMGVNHNQFKAKSSSPMLLEVICVGKKDHIRLMAANGQSRPLGINGFKKYHQDHRLNQSRLVNASTLKEESLISQPVEQREELWWIFQRVRPKGEIEISIYDKPSRRELLPFTMSNRSRSSQSSAKVELRQSRPVPNMSPSTSDWMRTIPDETPLSSLYLPGTHESLALYGYPISTCQSPHASIPWQLDKGIRFLDFRFALIRQDERNLRKAITVESKKCPIDEIRGMNGSNIGCLSPESSSTTGLLNGEDVITNSNHNRSLRHRMKIFIRQKAIKPKSKIEQKSSTNDNKDSRGELRAYHGIQDEYISAEEAFGALYNFLESEAGKRETVIVSVKQENATPDFERVLWDLLKRHSWLWYVEDRWPCLGEVRGKAVLMCRFGFEGRRGLHPTYWPNSCPTPFYSPMGGQTALFQDWYNVGSFVKIPEKTALVLSLCDFRRSSSGSDGLVRDHNREAKGSFLRRPLRINFTSGATLITAFPFVVAKGFTFGFGVSSFRRKSPSPGTSSVSTGISGLSDTRKINIKRGCTLFRLGFGLKGVNERVLEGLLKNGPELNTSADDATRDYPPCGMILVMDFCESPAGLSELMIAWNFLD